MRHNEDRDEEEGKTENHKEDGKNRKLTRDEKLTRIVELVKKFNPQD